MIALLHDRLLSIRALDEAFRLASVHLPPLQPERFPVSLPFQGAVLSRVQLAVARYKRESAAYFRNVYTAPKQGFRDCFTEDAGWLSDQWTAIQGYDIYGTQGYGTAEAAERVWWAVLAFYSIHAPVFLSKLRNRIELKGVRRRDIGVLKRICLRDGHLVDAFAQPVPPGRHMFLILSTPILNEQEVLIDVCPTLNLDSYTPFFLEITWIHEMIHAVHWITGRDADVLPPTELADTPAALQAIEATLNVGLSLWTRVNTTAWQQKLTAFIARRGSFVKMEEANTILAKHRTLSTGLLRGLSENAARFALGLQERGAHRGSITLPGETVKPPSPRAPSENGSPDGSEGEPIDLSKL